MIRNTKNTAVKKKRKKKNPRETTQLHKVIQMMDHRAQKTRTCGGAR